MSIIEQMSWIDLLVGAVYVIGMALIGVYASKKIKNSKDFTSAGQQLSWQLVAGSTIATCMGGNMVMGKYDLIHQFGLSGMTTALFWWVGWIFLLLMTKKFRKSGATSIPTFLEQRYNPATKKICSYCVLITVISSCAGIFLSVGTILEALGICNRTVGTWVGAAIIIGFTIFSGLWGVAITDTIQAVILAICFGIVFPLAVFHTAGGWENVVAANPPERLNLFTGIAPITMVGWAVSYSLSVGADPTFAQRIFSAKSTKDAVLGQGIAWVVTLLVAGILSALPALAIPHIFPDLTVGSEFAPRYIVTYMPVLVSGLMLAALMGLMLTSGDSYLLLLASTITDDIIRPKRPNMSDKRALLLTRLVCVASAGVICAMAMYVDEIYQLFKTGGGAYGAGVFLPLLLGCFWKRANTKAINLAMVVGCVTSFCFDLFLKVPLQLDMDGCILGAGLCLVICVVGSLLAPKDQGQSVTLEHQKPLENPS